MGLFILYVTLFAGLLHMAYTDTSAVAPTKTLNDGNKIPILGLGTNTLRGDQVRQIVNWVVEAGYRLIDTASLYKNEADIGKGIKDVIKRGLVKREDLFIITKLWNDKHARNQVVPAIRESLRNLGLDYVDLYLMHYPRSMKPDRSPAYVDYLEAWEGMEEAKQLGLAKSIGVSNFNTAQVMRVIENSNTTPAVNQIEVHPSFTNEALVSDMQNLGITVMAYTPFGFLVNRDRDPAPPPHIDDPTLTKIGQKYGKSTTQVVLRYLIERGIIPIPKSTNKERLKQNIDVFDFTLTPEEVDTINKLNVNEALSE